jgi:uncharacterized membrane protein YphA (DoxX/SURF4 family)
MRTLDGSAAPTRRRVIAYWSATLALAAELLLGGIWGVLRIPYVRGVFDDLGYPDHLLVIMGAWELLGAVALLMPGAPRLKEWVYAGMVFVFTGAVASHVAVGDGIRVVVYPAVLIGLTMASWALRPTARRDLGRTAPAAARPATTDDPRRARLRTVGYWVATAIVAGELAVGAVWDILRIPYVRRIIAHLGYPEYFLVIMGVWKLPGAVVLLLPRCPRLKEWAYAGAFFVYSGAAISHLAVGDGAGPTAAPIAFAGLTVASWVLRAPDRRNVTATGVPGPADLRGGPLQVEGQTIPSMID